MNSDINKQAAKSAAKVAEQAAKVSAAAANVAVKQEAKAQYPTRLSLQKK